MKLAYPSSCLAALLASSHCSPSLSAQEEIVLEASRDNTLYEPLFGPISNGAGDFLFAGLTNLESKRRGLVYFDVAGSLPSGARVLQVELEMYCSKASNTLPKEVGLHRALAKWGEGDSDASNEEGEGDDAQPGDATWFDRIFPSEPWTAPGGDFAANASSTAAIEDIGDYKWPSTAALVSDVQIFLGAPELNHGWVVVGEELGADSAKRFNSRENSVVERRPRLRIMFDPEPCAGGPAGEVLRPGLPPNPIAFLPQPGGAPVLGSAWAPQVDHTSFVPDAILDFLLVSEVATNVEVPPFGTLLCGVNQPIWQQALAPGAPISVPVPDDCSFVGLDLCSQVLSVDPYGVGQLTNAIDLVIGDR